MVTVFGADNLLKSLSPLVVEWSDKATETPGFLSCIGFRCGFKEGISLDSGVEGLTRSTRGKSTAKAWQWSAIRGKGSRRFVN